MIRAQITTPWTGTGAADDENRPHLAGAYALSSWTDVTGQQNVVPDPNLYTVEITCTQAVYDAIAADPAYDVLWAEPLEERIEP
ncbi:MAG: hypothetical protein R3272_13675 [Candidatus Promineifilaceae bacterium]|nr:hypothetical protein [Candidatus Promineifilaceae bacterium]